MKTERKRSASSLTIQGRKKRSSPEREGGSGDLVKKYLREIDRLPRITPAQERELAWRIRCGDKEALRELVEANLCFVTFYVKRYQGCGLHFLDLVEEGNIGLIEAARRFDPEKGVKFISYAEWWVRQAVVKAIHEESRLIRLPQKQATFLRRIRETQATLSSELLRDPTPQEIADRMQVPVEDVVESLQIGEEVSLSAVIDEEHNFRLSEKLEDKSVPSPEFVALQRIMRRLVRSILHELSSREERVLRLRFGLDDDCPRTLEEIGRIMGLSRERIRQIEAEAFDRIAQSQKGRKLRGFLRLVAS